MGGRLVVDIDCIAPLLLLAIIWTQSRVVLVLIGIWGGETFGALYALWVICQKSYALPIGCSCCFVVERGRRKVYFEIGMTGRLVD